VRVPDRGRRISNVSHSFPAEDDLSARRHDDLGRDIEALLERLAESREAIVRLLAAGSGADETVPAEASGDDETVAEEASTDDETVAEELWHDNEIRYASPVPVGALRPLRNSLARPAEAEVAPPAEPGSTSPQVVAAEAPEPQPAGEVASYQLPSSLRRPGPPALELALIYREIARKDGEVHPEAAPATAVYHSEPEGLKPLAEPQGAPPEPEPSTAMPIVKIPVQRRAPVAVKPLRVKKTDTGPRAVNGAHAARRRLLAVVLTAVGAVVLLTTVVSLLPAIVSAL
jgi:hypothetical protein